MNELRMNINILDTIFITVMAVMAPRKTAIRDFCTDIIEVIKNVLSPNSDAVISELEAIKDFQKVLAIAYGVMFDFNEMNIKYDQNGLLVSNEGFQLKTINLNINILNDKTP